jgi:tetratricopeptide (TPR) repeat protein
VIDPLTTWQQVCTVLTGPAAPVGLESETTAAPNLPQEDFEAAFSILEAAIHEATLQKVPALDRARLHLYLASLQSLYGDAASDEAQATLSRAALLAPDVRQTPLYLALSAELDARLRGPEATYPDVQAIHGDPLSRFHAVSALALADRSQEALGVHVTVQELPPHLGWRLRSWQADCEEMQGNTEAAMHLYAEAARLSRGSYRAGMLQEQAALHLQLGQPTEAAAVLERARTEYPPLPDNLGSTGVSDSADLDGAGLDVAGQVLGLASWHYLMSQAALNQDQHDAALENIQEADRLERLMGDPSYGVALVYGQVLVAQGRQQEALRHFDAALLMAQPEDRPYALHELGVAFLDLDRPLEARERLESAAGTPDYPFVPEVLADIAEAEYRLGRLPEAQATAELALAQGAVVPASLVLGSVEMDYYHLDEALEHYLRVAREAAPGTRDWVTAEQMVADIMAQQGFPDPTSAYMHAQQAMEYTDPSDDWYGTLQDHLSRAETLMGTGKGRTLN